ncbi:DUF932 domain-containing protein [Candidatus Pacearchaeota archaeon]|nr:DUF932 domain-containing protein [Candidatus Pacearchaeota archaeon]
MVAKASDIVWDVNDKYGHARAIRIRTPEGEETKFSMVYGKDESNKWMPVRPVSDRFTPIGTEDIIKRVVDRLGGDGEIFTERVRLGRGGVSQQVELVLKSNEIKIGDAPEDKDSHLISQGIIGKNGDIWRPTVRVLNALDGTKSISVMAGWFRLVCSNGMTVEAWQGSSSHTIKIHTVHQVDKALNEIENFDFNVKAFRTMLKKLRGVKIDKAEMKRIQKALPKNYMMGLDKIPERTAYGVINYVSYIQSHEMSMNRGGIVQPIINSMLKKAA